jgi:hypothetical protein
MYTIESTYDTLVIINDLNNRAPVPVENGLYFH